MVHLSKLYTSAVRRAMLGYYQKPHANSHRSAYTKRVHMTAIDNTQYKPVFPRLLRRIRASMIDSVVYILIFALWFYTLPYLQNFPGPARIALPIMLWLILDTLLVSTTGGTIGHHLMNIKVVDSRSLNHIGLFRATCRNILRIFLGGFSLIFIFVTKKHQALHDLVIGSNVVFKNVEKVPASERRTERLPDQNYHYPAIWRRTVLIILYLIVSYIAISVAITLLVSTDCIMKARCSDFDEIIQPTLGIVTLVAAAVIVINGCRGLLPGARRKLIDKNL